MVMTLWRRVGLGDGMMWCGSVWREGRLCCEGCVERVIECWREVG